MSSHLINILWKYDQHRPTLRVWSTSKNLKLWFSNVFIVLMAENGLKPKVTLKYHLKRKFFFFYQLNIVIKPGNKIFEHWCDDKKGFN